MTIEAIKPIQLSRRGLLSHGMALGAAAALAAAAKPASAGSVGADPAAVGPIYRALRPNDMSMIEQEHVPQFLAPEMAIRGSALSLAVQAGSLIHPMDPDHRIERLRVLDEAGHPLTDMTFSSNGMMPGCEIYLKVDKTTTFVAQVFCTQHGIWEARHRIAV
jgi:desulfoferrodoxin (superoxide reductase-like protein)